MSCCYGLLVSCYVALQFGVVYFCCVLCFGVACVESLVLRVVGFCRYVLLSCVVWRCCDLCVVVMCCVLGCVVFVVLC